MQKNDIIELEITDLTNEGNGVGRYNGIAVFVPYTAIGDVIKCRIVKDKKSYYYGIIESIIKPSESRLSSDCEAFGRCGGCSFRHITYEQELSAKQKFVTDAFKRIGGLDVEFSEIIGAKSTSNYRNKAQFPISTDENGKLYAGYYAKRSHRAIKCESCNLLPSIFLKICNDILDFSNERGLTSYNEKNGEGLLRHIFLRQGYHSGEIMIAIVATSKDYTNEFRALAKSLSVKYTQIKSFLLNVNSRSTNVILGDESITLFGEDHIHDIMCGNLVEISLKSFYQINTHQAELLYSKAAELASLTKDDTLLDLYCGAGTIGLSMAKNAKNLIGVEIVPESIENAKQNANINSIDNCEFICGDAGKAAKLLYEKGEHPNVIIADPARKGCDKASLEYMTKMVPDKIVMISCNPSTAARDCAILEELGYKAIKGQAVDLFPRTGHVECIILIVRKK